eukprot:scaffold11561_cov72-Phaeocystis_antarctica.AAC.3
MSDPPRWRRALAAQPVEWLSDRVARTGLRSAGCPRAVVEAQALPPAPGAGVADDDFGLRMLHCAVTQQARQQCDRLCGLAKLGITKETPARTLGGTRSCQSQSLECEQDSHTPRHKFHL